MTTLDSCLKWAASPGQKQRLFQRIASSKDDKHTFSADIYDTADSWCCFGSMQNKKNDKASYKIGDTTTENHLSLQTLKAQDPSITALALRSFGQQWQSCPRPMQMATAKRMGAQM